MRLRGLPPVENHGARVLVLGSMPGVVSLEEAEYYAHPRNAFWRVLEPWGVEPGAPYPTRCAQVRRLGLALWDVIGSCRRVGSLDASIRDAEINDFADFFARHRDLRVVLCNGAKAHALFVRHVTVPDGMAVHRMPSTSPANTRPGKVAVWRARLRESLAGSRGSG